MAVVDGVAGCAINRYIAYAKAAVVFSAWAHLFIIPWTRQERIAWLCYPKAGKLATDLNRDILWSAMRFPPKK